MSSTRQCIVVGTETGPSAELAPTFDVLTVRDGAAVVNHVEANAVDCVVVHESAATPIETIEAVRAAAPSVPIIYATATPDGAAAAAATRAGATEYYAGTTEQTLGDRLSAHADRSGTMGSAEAATTGSPGTERANETSSARRVEILEGLHGIISDDSVEFETRLDNLLAFGRRALGVEYATLSRIEGDSYEFRYVAGVDDAISAGQTLALSDAYCERIAATETSLSFDSVSDDRPDLRDRGAYTELGIRCFLGAPVTVDSQLWGSLCFFAREDRVDGFTDWDRTVVELLADWAGHALEHRHRRRQLEQSRATFEQTIERIDDAFFALDEEWKVTYLNGRAEELIDPDGMELIGNNIWDAFPDAVGMTFESQYRHAMAEQEPVSFEEYFPPLSTWFEVRAYPSETGLSVYFTDITERKERELERKRYETIVETIDDGVLVINSEQRVAKVNDAYADLVGHDPDTLLGKHASTLVDDETWIEWMEIVMSLSAGTTNHAALETDLQRADGTTVPIEANITPLPSDDDDSGFVCIIRDISERKRREAIVTRLLETTRTLFACESRDAVAEAIIDAASSTFGYSIIGVRLYDADTDTLRLAAASDCVEAYLGERSPVPVGHGPIGVAFERSEPVLLEDARTNSEYDLVHGHDTGLRGTMCIPIGDVGVLSIGSTEPETFDESDRQLAQLLTASAAVALERADRRETLVQHEQVLESVEGMVYAIDADGRFTLVTEPLAERAGYDRESLLGEHVSTVLDAESAERGRQHVTEMLMDPHRNSTVFEATGTAADGERFPIEIECSLLPASDGFRGTVGAVRDITQRKEREQYLRVLNRVLRHNLRNDLTVIIGYTELLLDRIDDKELGDATATLHETATDLVRTSEKARAIKYALDRDEEPKPVDVASLVDDVIGSIETDGVDVCTSTPDSCWARADSALSMVVENLFENAVRHAGANPTVDIAVTRTDDRVLLSVADDGPGIPDSEIEVVTGGSDITQLTHSSGLGLWLVRWIIDAYDGSISFDEGPLDGSQVTISLPHAPQADR